MSVAHCDHCGRPFFNYRKRCTHCKALRDDLQDTSFFIRQPMSLLPIIFAVAGLMLIWSLVDDRPSYAASVADETYYMQTHIVDVDNK